MKNEIVSLMNAFLYENEVDRISVLKEIRGFIERTFLEADLVLAQNVMNTYSMDFENYFVDPSKARRVQIIQAFTFILSLLNLQE